MDIRLQTRYLKREEIDAHAGDANFRIKEPGLFVIVLVQKKDRTKKIPLFIPESDLKRMMD